MFESLGIIGFNLMILYKYYADYRILMFKVFRKKVIIV